MRRQIKESELRCYDNGGKTIDRYTVLPPRYAGADWRERDGSWMAIGASSEPFHPQGVGQHCAAQPGSHLGRRVAFDALPADVQGFARQTFCGEAWEVAWARLTRK